jgi:diaminohydroxyphosphoribosylaminopyrimidine deaminase / 5-amino-6-(5-phosphoribosylamino)uracil reductase
MLSHKIYMERCIELAANGLGHAAPNPLVGCVIVYDDQVIGEGYHREYGKAHAEVNAINSVQDKDLLKHSRLYVNLEPCAHWGKTPPCSDLVIQSGIPEVVIGCQDSYAEVNGKGIQKLRDAGVKVETGILERESLELNRRFFTFHAKKRPYIILKWAQTRDGFMARDDFSSKWISNPYSRLLVHQWRGEEAAVMVGTRTAQYDNPRLNSRDMFTHDPVRVVTDKTGTLPNTHHIFDGSQPTIIFTAGEKEPMPNLEYVKIDFESDTFMQEMLNSLYHHDIQSLIVEGGQALLNSFLEKDLWDEARVFESPDVYFRSGIKAPHFAWKATESLDISGDQLGYYYH